MSDFLPCPRCRSTKKPKIEFDRHDQDITCVDCGYSTGYCYVAPTAWEKWREESNQRATAMSDPVNFPDHYRSHPSGIECIDVVEHMGFCVGSAMKYLWRHRDKGKPLEDLRKARWYVDREIQRLESEIMGKDWQE